CSTLIAVSHNVSGGPTISRWLHTATPPIPDQGSIAGRLGFASGGYLAIAIGLTFIVLGSSLPSTYYLFWAIAFFIIGGLSVDSFPSYPVSQLVCVVPVSVRDKGVGMRLSSYRIALSHRKEDGHDAFFSFFGDRAPPYRRRPGCSARQCSPDT